MSALKKSLRLGMVACALGGAAGLPSGPTDAATVTFQTTVPSLPYSYISGEGGSSIENNVASSSPLGPLSIGAGSTDLRVEFYAPAGSKFRYDASAYPGEDGTIYFGSRFETDGSFADFSGVGTPVIELINASGVSVPVLGQFHSGFSLAPGNQAFSASAGGTFVLDEGATFGTFDGLRFSYGLSNTGTSQSATLFSNTFPTEPTFEVDIVAAADNGAILTYVAVPEPSANLMIFGGLAGLAFAGRQVRRAKLP